MSTITPTTIYANNSVGQDLFTIEEFIAPSATTRGVTRYGSVGNQAVLTYSDLLVYNNIDAGLDNVTGQIYLGALVTYTITVQAQYLGPQEARIRIVNSDTGQPLPNIDYSVPANGTPLIIMTATNDPLTLQAVIYTVDQSLFVNPSRVQGAQITIQAVAGYENA